jgi:transposase
LNPTETSQGQERNAETEMHTVSIHIFKMIMSFLELFMCKTLAKRLMSLVLIAVGLPNSRITELTGLSDRSIRSLKKVIADGDTESLFTVGGGGRKGKLADVEKEIVEEIENNNYHSRQEIADMILEKFSLKVSLSAIGKFLKKNGIKRLKCGSLPAKADTQKQSSFYETTLYPLIEQAKSGEIALLFLDASHFVMGCDFLGYIYGTVRRFIKTYSGRMRYNVLGALNFVTKKVTTVTNNTYITATEVCDLLRKISAEYSGKAIHLVLDNARYQKCKVVQELAEELGIALVYIPPYSPNLNLIERLWKFVKSRLRTKYYDRFDIFQKKIDSIVNSTSSENKSMIDKLINEKVQLFKDLVPLDENSFANREGNRCLAA